MRHLRQMRRAALIGGLMALCCNAGPAVAWDRGEVQTFAVLPQGATGPEGIAVAQDGKVYVGTFGFTTTGPVAGPGKIYVFNDDGRLLRTLTVGGSTAQLLGLGFNPNMQHALLAVDFGAGRPTSPWTSGCSVSRSLPCRNGSPR